MLLDRLCGELWLKEPIGYSHAPRLFLSAIVTPLYLFFSHYGRLQLTTSRTYQKQQGGVLPVGSARGTKERGVFLYNLFLCRCQIFGEETVTSAHHLWYTVPTMGRNDLITILVFIFLIGAGLGFYAAKIYMSGG